MKDLFLGFCRIAAFFMGMINGCRHFEISTADTINISVGVTGAVIILWYIIIAYINGLPQKFGR